jgi:hypothetical protein
VVCLAFIHAAQEAAAAGPAGGGCCLPFLYAAASLHYAMLLQKHLLVARLNSEYLALLYYFAMGTQGPCCFSCP